MRKVEDMERLIEGFRKENEQLKKHISGFVFAFIILSLYICYFLWAPIIEKWLHISLPASPEPPAPLNIVEGTTGFLIFIGVFVIELYLLTIRKQWWNY